jgi:hypothetical protein
LIIHFSLLSVYFIFIKYLFQVAYVYFIVTVILHSRNDYFHTISNLSQLSSPKRPTMAQLIKIFPSLMEPERSVPNPLPYPYLGPVRIFTSYLYKINFNIIIPSKLISPKWSPQFTFELKFNMNFSSPSMHVPPSHPL